MNDLEFFQVAATLWIIASILGLGIFAYRKYNSADRKLDDIHGEAKGIRIRLERHAEESQDESRAMQTENKKARAQIYEMFAQFLAYLKCK